MRTWKRELSSLPNLRNARKQFYPAVYLFFELGLDAGIGKGMGRLMLWNCGSRWSHNGDYGKEGMLDSCMEGKGQRSGGGEGGGGK